MVNVLSHCNAAIGVAQKEQIDDFILSKTDICMTKVSKLSSSATLANSFLLICLTQLVMNKVSVRV